MAIDRQSLSGQADSLIATLDAVATARRWIRFAAAVPALLLEIRITRGTCENIYDDVRCRVTKPLDELLNHPPLKLYVPPVEGAVT